MLGPAVPLHDSSRNCKQQLIFCYGHYLPGSSPVFLFAVAAGANLLAFGFQEQDHAELIRQEISLSPVVNEKLQVILKISSGLCIFHTLKQQPFLLEETQGLVSSSQHL